MYSKEVTTLQLAGVQACTCPTRPPPAAYPTTGVPAVVPFNSAYDERPTGHFGSMSRYLRTWLAVQVGTAQQCWSVPCVTASESAWRGVRAAWLLGSLSHPPASL